jgi:hypothetical protein
MLAAKQLALGLLFMHGAWLWFWLCGSLVLWQRRTPETSDEALLDIILASVTGMAITALVTFALGLFGALYPVAALVALVATLMLLSIRRPSVAAAAWKSRLSQVARAASPGALIVWMFGVFLAAMAIIPDNGSDATAFYYPQALDYARSHWLVVDPLFRFPYYPNNWVLVETWPFVLGFPSFVQFLNALTAVLTLLGVFGLTVFGGRELTGSAGLRGLRAIAVAAALCVAIAPIFVHFVDIGMTDIPSGLAYLATVIAATVAVREKNVRALPALILCAGFLVGTKLSFPALLPFFAGLCWIVLRSAGASRTAFPLGLIALVLVSAPWYARAFVLAGDPVTPLLNLRFQGRDPQFTQDDLRRQAADVAGDTSPLGLLRLPIQLFADPSSREVRDWGGSLLLSCFPAALVYVGWVFVGRRRVPNAVTMTALAVAYGYAYWTETSHLGRYALLFLPSTAAFVGIAAARASRRSVRMRFFAAAVVFVLATPAPASWQYYQLLWRIYYATIGTYYTTPAEYLRPRSPAYAQIEDVSHMLRRAKRTDLRIYFVYLGGAQYFVKQHGAVMMGDSFGPGRFYDFARALERERAEQFLRRFDVGVVIAHQSSLDKDLVFAGMEVEMLRIGWREVRYPGDDWVVFLSPQLPALRQGEGREK